MDGIESEKCRQYPEFSREVAAQGAYRWDVFISYSSLDRSTIAGICSDMKARGIRCWWDEEEVQPGDQFMDKIEEGLLHSRVLLPCFSRNQLRSGWCRGEYTCILDEVLSGRTAQKVMPLFLDDIEPVDIPVLMRGIRAVKYSSRQDYEKLLQTLQSLSRRE